MCDVFLISFYSSLSPLASTNRCILYFLDVSLPSPISVINKTIEEDRFDIPDVPMEED